MAAETALEKKMADDTDKTGLGLIVGILIAVVFIVLALGVGPRYFGGSPTQVTIEAPSPPVQPAPAPKG